MVPFVEFAMGGILLTDSVAFGIVRVGFVVYFVGNGGDCVVGEKSVAPSPSPSEWNEFKE